ncbi:MAG: hypothetical protein AAGD92_08690 [Pseudomonadota bacterium]
MNLLAILLTPFALAPEGASERYLDCLSLVEADVELGRRAAQLWVGEGATPSAQHCLAVADLAAGFSKLGAARLEALAERKDAGDEFIRARLLAQAAEAWLAADEADSADRAIKAAFEHAPGAGELHLTAASVHAAKGRQQQVVAAISAAEQAGFATPRGYVERGRAYLALGAYVAAAEDVVNALTLEPTNIDALTLRGDVQRTGIDIDVSLRPAPAQQ